MRLSDPDAQHFILDERLIQRRSFFDIISHPWSSQTIVPKAGISQEIFRNGTTYAHSVGPNFTEKRPYVYEGDCVYSVSLMPRAYSFSGVVTTKEGKPRGYDMNLEMKVANATRFMEAYHHSQDPAYSTFAQFKQVFEYYVSKMDDTTETKLSPWLDRYITMFTQRYGIQIINPVWFFHISHETLRKEDAGQAAQRKKRDIEIEYDLRMYEEQMKGKLVQVQEDQRRDKKARQSTFARSERKKEAVINEQIRLLSNTVSSLIQINNDRITDNIGYNLPTQDILKDSLKLLANLNNSLDNSPQEAETIPGSSPSDELIFGHNEDENGPITTVNSTVNKDDEDFTDIAFNAAFSANSDQEEVIRENLHGI